MNKKYFSKALCYADRSHYFSIMIMTTLYLLLVGLVFITDRKNAANNSLDIFIISVPVILINALIIFFSYTGKNTKQFYMTTQPYNKDAMIITKLICFSLSFIVPIVIYAVIVSLLYLTGTNGITNMLNASVHSPMALLWENVVIASVSFISIVSGIQFLQILFGKCRYALLIPLVFGMFIIPITVVLICFYLNGVSSSLGNALYNIATTLLNHLSSFGDLLLAKPGWSLLNDLVHIAVFTSLTIYLNRKVKSEKTDDIFTFKPIEIICKVLLAVFIGFLAVSFITAIIFLIIAKISPSSMNADISDMVVSIICVVILIAGAALSVLSYKIINKIQARRA